MITVSRATKKDLNGWRVKEWDKVDLVHYGRSVKWNEQEFMFKASEGGKLVGFITGKHEGGVLYISQIITTENNRSKGIGTMLVNRAEEYGKKHGAHKMWLITGKKWSENAFFQKVGFKKIGFLPDFHFHEDFVIYTKEIK